MKTLSKREWIVISASDQRTNAQQMHDKRSTKAQLKHNQQGNKEKKKERTKERNKRNYIYIYYVLCIVYI